MAYKQKMIQKSKLDAFRRRQKKREQQLMSDVGAYLVRTTSDYKKYEMLRSKYGIHRGK